MAKTIADFKEEYAIAKAKGDVEGMKAANDGANVVRSQTGGLLQYANEDIANVQAQVDAVKAQQTPSATSVGGISATAGGTPYYESSSLPETSDYSGYINDLYAAQQNAALKQLEAAYNQNMAELSAAEEDIAPYYQTARNQTAASSEQSKRNFAEYANAYGLNSGTSGQSELARSLSLQNNLNSLSQAEADAYSELELQRTQAANEYNAAIASAKASGAYQMANALYQEKVRVDEALLSTAYNQAQLDYQTYQSYYSALQAEKDDLTSYGKLWLQYGEMPSDAALKAMDLTKEAAQAMIDRINGG